jgi:hypothetical protein
MRRWQPAIGVVVTTVVLVLIVSGTGQPGWPWRAILLAWWVATVAHSWRLANRGWRAAAPVIRGEPRPARRERIIAAAVTLAVLATLVVVAMRRPTRPQPCSAAGPRVAATRPPTVRPGGPGAPLRHPGQRGLVLRFPCPRARAPGAHPRQDAVAEQAPEIFLACGNELLGSSSSAGREEAQEVFELILADYPEHPVAAVASDRIAVSLLDGWPTRLPEGGGQATVLLRARSEPHRRRPVDRWRPG